MEFNVPPRHRSVYGDGDRDPRRWGRRGLCLTLHCHHQNDIALRWAFYFILYTLILSFSRNFGPPFLVDKAISMQYILSIYECCGVPLKNSATQFQECIVSMLLLFYTLYKVYCPFREMSGRITWERLYIHSARAAPPSPTGALLGLFVSP